MSIEKEKLVSAFKNWLEDRKELPDDFQKSFKKEIDKKNNKYPIVLSIINEQEANDLFRLKNAIQATTALEKVLMAILWKQGDYNKINTFINDLIDEGDENKKSGFVFQQFAQHVKERSAHEQYEPIIDQHTLRAFLVLKGEEKIEDSHKITTIDKKLAVHFPAYIKWFNELLEQGHEAKQLDDYLFVLGKMLKKSKDS